MNLLGLVITRGSQSQPPSSQSTSNSDPLAGPSQPLNKKFHETPVNAPIYKGKQKYPEEDGTGEEDVRHMEMETDAPTHLDTPQYYSRDHCLLTTPFFHSHHARLLRPKRILPSMVTLLCTSSSIDSDLLARQAFEQQIRQDRGDQYVLQPVWLVRLLIFSLAQPHSS